MKVAVLGAGVIGTTTAYFLARDGHEVTVVDRQALPAAETSYANAGLLAPGHAFSWASPKAPWILARSLFQADQALRLKLRADPRMWLWMLRFLRECTAQRARVNTVRKLALCRYSLEMLKEVVAETGVTYDARTGGNLYLHRTQKGFDAGIAHMRILSDHGLEIRVLDRDQVAALEPALAPVRARIAGGILSPSDESGDARMFTRNLADWCRARQSVAFRMQTEVLGLDVDGGRVHRVVTDRGYLEADAVVLALGCDSPFVGRRLGLPLPVHPVKGYSVTLPVGGSSNAPLMGGVDEDNLVAWARMGERLRITSTAEFSGYDRGHRPEDFRAMLNAARDLFPDAADYDQPEYWAGLRPMTPGTTPILGFARHRNLLVNTGHGHIGWTMACGSAKVTADLLAGRATGVRLEGLLYGQPR
jgi:D-amino-acid dehydrogenase